MNSLTNFCLVNTFVHSFIYRNVAKIIMKIVAFRIKNVRHKMNVVNRFKYYTGQKQIKKPVN